QLNQDHPFARNYLGIAHKAMGKFDEAMAEFRKAIEKNPYFADLHNNLGEVYYKKAMINEGLIEFKKAISLNPDYAAAHYNLSFVYGDKNMLEEAEREFKKASDLNPNFGQGAQALLSIERPKTMEEKVAEKVAAQPMGTSNADTYLSLAAAYKGKGLLDEAIREYRRA